MATLAELVALATAWIAEDPDQATRAELADLVASAQAGSEAAVTELADAFDGTLTFGTAGLRGRLGPGSRRMNRVVVARSAAGVAAYMQATGGTSIVIGYDARRNSEVFARDTAEVMAAAGLRTFLLPSALPTPVLAFAIHELGCSAGVMVTASHNPPEDNGYKVYLADGGHIVPPADVEIAVRIAQAAPASQIPRSTGFTILGSDIVDAYVARVVALVGPGPRDVRAVYTPLHGVGGEVFVRAVMDAGFPEPIRVVEQFEPDGRFPTVAFPNPEEPGALDLALATASGSDADVIIANDPDADRCAAGVRVGDSWRMLTGDELGAVLGWWVVQRQVLRGEAPHGVFATSIVSSTMLEAIASTAGLDCVVTLPGFKWMARVPGLVYGYEEALGYCVDPGHVTDKDGISASLLFLECVAHLKNRGRSVPDVLDDLSREHGLHVTSQISVRVADVVLIADAMRRLRTTPPTHLGHWTVERIEDLSDGVDGLPPLDGLRFIMDGARVIVRPSGTEPKLKCYLQVVLPVADDLALAKVHGDEEMDELRAAVSAAIGQPTMAEPPPDGRGF